ncbi:hypothetical protein PYR66_11845 [Klebsiella aerogenes]|nr:hypothetical protein PYR66_11845 [Klebsiella aerogenes]
MRFTIISTKAEHQTPQGNCDFYAPGGEIADGATEYIMDKLL